MHHFTPTARTLILLAATAFTSHAFATTNPPPAAPPSTMPAGAKMPPPAVRDVDQVQMGRPAATQGTPQVTGAPSTGPQANTGAPANPEREVRERRLRLLEDLQFQIAEAELRKKLADARGGTPAPGGASSATTLAPSAQSPSPRPANAQPASGPAPAKQLKARTKVAPQPAAAATPGMAVVSLVPPPRPPEPALPDAKVLNFVSIGEKVRAEILVDGRQVTMKVGEKLGVWKIAEVTNDGVYVEHRRSVQDLRPEIKAALAAGQASPQVGPQGAFITVEDVVRKRLEPMYQATAAAIAPPPALAPKQPPTTQPAPVVVPPLPNGPRAPDSSSLPGAAPLPPNTNLPPIPSGR